MDLLPQRVLRGHRRRGVTRGVAPPVTARRSLIYAVFHRGEFSRHDRAEPFWILPGALVGGGQRVAGGPHPRLGRRAARR